MRWAPLIKDQRLHIVYLGVHFADIDRVPSAIRDAAKGQGLRVTIRQFPNSAEQTTFRYAIAFQAFERDAPRPTIPKDRTEAHRLAGQIDQPLRPEKPRNR